MNTTSAWVTILVGSVAAIGCLPVAFYNLNRKRIIDDTPTSRTQGVFIGLAELKGTAESETRLTSYLAASKCVQYSWKIEEQWRRVVTEIVSDGKGHTTTRTRVETGWTDVGHADESQSFYLKDDTGVIRIVLEMALFLAHCLS